MLSLKKFDAGMSLLEQNYDRKLTDAIRKIWFQYLDVYLTDEEFLTAVKHIILHSRFMPTASELVDHIHGGKEAKAIQEWQTILNASTKADFEEILAYLSNRARVALHAVGGLRQVALAEEYQRQRLEKSFITVYCQCSSKDAKSLPQSSPTPVQKAVEEAFEPTPMPEHLRQQVEALKSKLAMNGKPQEEVA